MQSRGGFGRRLRGLVLCVSVRVLFERSSVLVWSLRVSVRLLPPGPGLDLDLSVSVLFVRS